MPKIRTVVGHKEQLSQLSQDIAENNITHAYLLSGPAHLGKMAVAYSFAADILTKNLSEEKAKEARRSIENLTHADLLVLDQLWIEKTCEDWDAIARSSNVNQQHRSKKSPPAKTDSIGIDDIRSLQSRLHETRLGEYGCCIIRGIDRMQDAAANAFLKILEEPPQGLVFLLTTQSESALLPTILSRARVLRFSPLSQKVILPILDKVNEEDKGFIVKLAQGAPGIAYSLRDDPDALRKQKQIYEKTLSFWKEAKLKSRLQMLSPLHSRGEEANEFLFHLALSLRQQSPDTRGKFQKPFLQMAKDLQTNAHRQLITQRFAIAITS